MPYITKADRLALDTCSLLDKFLERFNQSTPSEGELNYVITKLLLSTNPKRYADFNKLVGVLECCKLEFYRRAVAVYEDKKIKENGDVY